LPDYVKHRDGTAEIDKLSADAIHENEVTAIDPKSTSAQRFEYVARCETVRHGALAIALSLSTEIFSQTGMTRELRSERMSWLDQLRFTWSFC
jgi:hypothetical protein